MVDRTTSHYKIVENIGQGDRGDVYCAKDTNLGRQVAIKVLPEQFTHDPQRLSRFERETQLHTSLNHPNVDAIHGLAESDGVWFLVLELVGGKTLGRAINEKPKPHPSAVPPYCQDPRLGYRLGPNVLRCDGALKGRVLATNRVSLQL